jgi:hypothetical protein
MQSEIKKMAEADPTSILFRLKEVWSISKDAELYDEFEMEKKRWMLSALHNLDSPVDTGPSKPAPFKITPDKTQKVLALYESQGRYI